MSGFSAAVAALGTPTYINFSAFSFHPFWKSLPDSEEVFLDGAGGSAALIN
jgi:hypothetical protein